VSAAAAPLRSLLFAPGNEPRKLEKVGAFGADAVILDLEDAVPDADKVASRALVRAALSRLAGASGAGPSIERYARLAAPFIAVRVNAPSTGLTEGDVAGVVAPGLDCVVLPKTERAQDVHALDAMLARAEAAASVPAGHVKILPLVETARGVLAGADVAAAGPRVVTLCFGSGDFTRDLELPSVRWSGGGTELHSARTRMVVDARAAGRGRPIDGPYLSVGDANGFEADCRRAAQIGFQGKLCIHPSQVPVANRVFAPPPEEVEFCRRVVSAFAAALARGSASITVDGVFVDYPIAQKAERIIATAEALAARDAAVAERRDVGRGVPGSRAR
jgi:citrate lyase subunit beta/citryl-CoA lyase